MRRGGAMTALFRLDIMELLDNRRERGESNLQESLTHQSGKSLRSGCSRNRLLRKRRIAILPVSAMQSWWRQYELL